MHSLQPSKPWTTKLSSAGLVYCHFGAQILANLLGQPEDGPVVTALYDKVWGGGAPPPAFHGGDPINIGVASSQRLLLAPGGADPPRALSPFIFWPQLYENFVEEIDAVDNGVAQTDGEPRYALTTHLSARVGRLNPRWNDPEQDTEVGPGGTRGGGGPRG